MVEVDNVCALEVHYCLCTSQRAFERSENLSCDGMLLHRHSVNIAYKDSIDFGPMRLCHHREI